MIWVLGRCCTAPLIMACPLHLHPAQDLTTSTCKPSDAVVSRQVIAQQNVTVTSFYSSADSSPELDAVKVLARNAPWLTPCCQRILPVIRYDITTAHQCDPICCYHASCFPLCTTSSHRLL